ncbi:MAG: RHS repeat-associated core domain-containing protein [Acidobacteria bacterium]|nr:RHS repeat-associated core domain-containing protein [Acidobacteriota bacterium]
MPTSRTRTERSRFGDETLTAARASGLGYTSADELRQDYTGYQKDNESGLEYAQARYYNTAHGRFTSVDPLTASATIRDPQSFNRYSYVLNSPYKFTDPLGLIPGFVNNSGGSYCSAAASNCDFGGHLDGSWFDESAPTQDSAGSSASEPQTGIESAGSGEMQSQVPPPPPPPPPMSPDQEKAIAKLDELIAAEKSSFLGFSSITDLGEALTAAKAEILNRIEAGHNNDVGLNIAIQAINHIGDTDYRDETSLNATGGPYSGNKCNLFVGITINNATSGAAVLGKTGYPLVGGKYPAANWLGDSRDVQRLRNIPVVTDGSLRMGDIVAYRSNNPPESGHSAIYIGGGIVVYAGGGVDGTPIAQTLSFLDSAMSRGHEPRTVRRYAGKP